VSQSTAPFVVATLIAASGFGATAVAQIGYTPSSIELLTAASDVVVRATVADLAYKDRAPGIGETRSQWQWVTVTLKVRATLKGKAPETIVFVIDQVRGMGPLPEWKKSGQSVLWFLVDIGDKKEETPPDFPSTPQGRLRLREHWVKFVNSGAIELGSPKTGRRIPNPMFSMDFRVLDDEDKILEAVEAEIARRHKRSEKSIGIHMPRDVAARSGTSGDVNCLHVPVNNRLNELGRAWILSKEEWMRLAGVQALRQFKSEANIGILKAVLDDKASVVEQNNAVRERVYPVREAAYKTLQEWKVPVAKPVLREPVQRE
jgi:hypothetical protein